jgi:hypothetical protein
MTNQVNFDVFLEIVQDHTKTPYQKAANLHAIATMGRADSQKPVGGQRQRRGRVGRVRVLSPASDSLIESEGHSENGEG